MAVLTTNDEIATAVPPAKLFKVFLVETHIYAPKALPDIIKNIDVLEGDGFGAGSIKQTNFVEGSGMKYLKAKVDLVDEANLTYIYTALEGEPWLETVEKVTYEIKLEAAPNGGSVYKTTTKYFPKGNAEIDSAKIKEVEEKGLALFKGFEAYLLANPDVGN